MASMTDALVLPRPEKDASSGGEPQNPIPGPSEAAFTDAFGTLLPPAHFLHTPYGKAAYYRLMPTTSSFHPIAKAAKTETTGPDRVLFIHGVQTPALGMLPLARALQATFPQTDVVLIDLWGHGLSDTPVVPHKPALFHGLLDTLLNHIAWPSAHFVGYSFGGSLTAGYAARRPSRVDSFVIIAPAGLLRAADLSPEEQAHLRDDCNDEAAARKWVLEWLEGGELIVPGDWKERVRRGEIVAEAVREWQMREHSGHVASVIAIVRDGGVMDAHAKFRKAAQTGIPAFAVLGEMDGVCSEQLLNEQGFNNVAIVPQVGHGVVRERVPEVAGLISGFWSRLGNQNEQQSAS